MSPLQNRVTPLGDLVAEPGRGLVFGNRGCLHDASGRIRRQFNGKRWIACRLEFRGRRRPLLEAGRYTGLFFLDEATAFAAGHRPCSECRHEDYLRFMRICGAGSAGEIDARLHGERVPRHGSRAVYGDLPDGAFVLHEGAPFLVLGGSLLRWSASGYVECLPRPGGDAAVVTPPTLLAVLRRGWTGAVPLLHPSAATLSRR